MIKIKDQTIRVGFQLGLAFLTAQFAIWLFFWKKLPPQVPLFYSRPWGEKQLASPLVVSILPGISVLAILTNLVLASFIPQKEKFISQLLVIFAAVLNFLCLVTLLKIVFLVT